MKVATSEPTLRVRGLSKYYPTARGAFHAARGVTFDVKEGDLYTLLGPSGCGKSTTLRCVAGLEHIDDGEIQIAGRTVNSSTPRVYVPPNRREIGMVFQNYGIWPHMNVFDNVAFPITVARSRLSRKEIARRTEEALQAVKLGHLSGRHATELSGGQQQRVALARALVARPKLLLLDEPLSNLDASLRESMRTELRNLQRDVGVTTLFVTHDQTEALSMSDRIAVMRDGVIVQEAPPREIYSRPVDRYVADFLGRINSFPAVVVGPDNGGHLVVQSGPARLRVRSSARCRHGNSVTLAVRPENLRLRPGDDGAPNSFDGTVLDASFLGDSVDYRVQVTDQVVVVKQPPAVAFPVGTRVRVAFDPADGLIYAD